MSAYIEIEIRAKKGKNEPNDLFTTAQSQDMMLITHCLRRYRLTQGGEITFSVVVLVFHLSASAARKLEGGSLKKTFRMESRPSTEMISL